MLVIDADFLALKVYQKFDLKRVFYSGFINNEQNLRFDRSADFSTIS